MSPFEFFFSLYGLVLGLSVSVIATGLASAIQHRRTVRIGRLTPLLALFVALDIASFWETAWSSFRQLPFSYGLLVAGLAIALPYFVAASLVFPTAVEDGADLDAHFWANKRPALLLTTLANSLLVTAAILLVRGGERGAALAVNYVATYALYVLLIVPAALSRRRGVVTACLAAHVAVYLAIAAANLIGTSLNVADPASRDATPGSAG